MTIKELLKKVDILNGLSDAHIDRVASICQAQSFDKGDVVVQQDAETADLYIIRSGLVEVIVEAPIAGKTIPLITLGEGQVFGEMSLVDEGARSSTVRSMVDGTQLYTINRDAFMKLCTEDTAIGFVVMKNIAADLSFKLRLRNLL